MVVVFMLTVVLKVFLVRVAGGSCKREVGDDPVKASFAFLVIGNSVAGIKTVDFFFPLSH